MNMHMNGVPTEQQDSIDQANRITPINWNARLSKFKSADNKKGLLELVTTTALFIGAWAITWLAYQYSVWLGLLCAIPAGGMIVRMFAIQHDCGHGSLFSSNRANNWAGRIIGVLTLTPYEYWRHSHALHHASSGNLDKRGVGDISTLTVEEYRQLSNFEKIKYRLYRNPFVMFGIGPSFIFILKQRLPFEMMNKGRKPWISTLGTNISVALIYAALIYVLGWQTFLLIQVPIIMIGATIGVWLFYVQHQFEETHWDRSDKWKREHAALHGSSYYALPQPLMWMTGNIGIHHVHHLSAAIPFHKLPKIIKEFPELKQIGRLSLAESFSCINLSLWDEKNREMISFREFKKRYSPSAA